jgi:hypothetical protein
MKSTRPLFWFTVAAMFLLNAAWRAPIRSDGSAGSQAAAAELGDNEQVGALLRARYTAASRLLELEEQRLQQGVTTLGRVCEVARWGRDSVLELPVSAEERVAALTKFVALAQRLEESVDRAVERGAAAEVDRETARYLRLDAEIALLRVRGQKGR